jgi:peptidoglycan/LPS O-acetylase OafA/YrhL
MAGLASGALVALAARGPRGLVNPIRTAGALVLLAIGIVGGVWACQLTGSWSVGAGDALRITVADLLSGAILLLAITTTPGTRVYSALTLPPLLVLGRLSYALYLFHVPVRHCIALYVFGSDQFFTIGGSQLPAQILFFGLSVGISLILAVLSWHLFESQFLKLKRFFSSRGPKAATTHAMKETAVTAAVTSGRRD